jgi:hypothetical protein
MIFPLFDIFVSQGRKPRLDMTVHSWHFIFVDKTGGLALPTTIAKQT